MVIGARFAWAHMGKTGGDATWRLFRCIPDLVEFAHAPEDARKHTRFTEADVAGKTLVLNLRRLPSLVLSYVHHARSYGLDETAPKGTVITPEEAVTFPRPERMIRNHTDRGRLDIGRWLRMEHLRDDFLEFARTLRPLTDDEVRAILSVGTKRPMSYDHDPSRFFTDDQIARLYRNSPTWARYERLVYGNLAVPVPGLTSTSR